MQVHIAVEDEDAVAVTDELFSMSEISGSWEPVDEDEREATIGTIVGIVGGTIAAELSRANRIKLRIKSGFHSSAMDITLKPEHAEFLRSQLASGRYHDLDEVIGEALNLLEQ